MALDPLARRIANGTCSVLEHAYLHEVEVGHGLPSGLRQLPVAGSTLRDVDHAPYPLAVELDGRLFHDDAAQRDQDLERDLAAAVGAVTARRTTIRLGRGQVLDRPCATAASVGLVLRRLGWEGTPAPCERCRLAA